MTQHNDWYVIANASRARILECTHALPWPSIANLVHPGSRLPAAALTSDRPGHVEGTGHGLGSSRFIPRSDPRQLEHDRFAREIAATIDAAVGLGRCSGLILVASNPFLGLLKKQLKPSSRKLLRKTVAHDYAGLSDHDLFERLRAATD